MKGFTTAQKLDKLGMRGSDTGELVFQDCEVPEENVLGEVGERRQRPDVAASTTSAPCSRPGRSASCRPALDVVMPYVHERKQFGQPIGEFQLVQGKLADMYVR